MSQNTTKGQNVTQEPENHTEAKLSRMGKIFIASHEPKCYTTENFHARAKIGTGSLGPNCYTRAIMSHNGQIVIQVQKRHTKAAPGHMPHK